MGRESARRQKKEEKKPKGPQQVGPGRLEALHGGTETSSDTGEKIMRPENAQLITKLEAKLQEYNLRRDKHPRGGEEWLDSTSKAVALETLLHEGSLNISEIFPTLAAMAPSDMDPEKAVAIVKNALDVITLYAEGQNAPFGGTGLHQDRGVTAAEKKQKEPLIFKKGEAPETVQNANTGEKYRSRLIASQTALENLKKQMEAAAGGPVTLSDIETTLGQKYTPENYADTVLKTILMEPLHKLYEGQTAQTTKQFETAVATGDLTQMQQAEALGIVSEVRKIAMENPQLYIGQFQSIDDPQARALSLRKFFGLDIHKTATPEQINKALDNNVFGPYVEALRKAGTPNEVIAAKQDEYDDALEMLEKILLRTQEALEAKETAKEHSRPEMKPNTQKPLTETFPFSEESLEKDFGKIDDITMKLLGRTPEPSIPKNEEVLDTTIVENRIRKLRTRMEKQLENIEGRETGIWAKLGRIFEDLRGAVTERRRLKKALTQLKNEKNRLSGETVGDVTSALDAIDLEANDIELMTPPSKAEKETEWTQLDQRTGKTIDENAWFNEENPAAAQNKRLYENLRKKSLIELEIALREVGTEILELGEQVRPHAGEAGKRMAELQKREAALQDVIREFDADKDPYGGKIFTIEEGQRMHKEQDRRGGEAIAKRNTRREEAAILQELNTPYGQHVEDIRERANKKSELGPTRKSAEQIRAEYQRMTPGLLDAQRDQLLQQLGIEAFRYENKIPEAIREAALNAMMQDYEEAVIAAGAKGADLLAEKAAYQVVLDETRDHLTILEEVEEKNRMEKDTNKQTTSVAAGPIQSSSHGKKAIQRARDRHATLQRKAGKSPYSSGY